MSTICLFLCFSFGLSELITECPTDEWEQHYGKCYLLDSYVSAGDGASMCSQIDAVMISPKSDVEKMFLTDFLRRRNLKSAWIGLNDTEIEGRFVWQDGSPLKKSQTAWQSDSPNNDGGQEHCVEVDPYREHNQAWNDTNCDRHNNIICQSPDKLVDPKMLTTCPSEQWQHHHGNCYWFDRGIDLSFDDARHMCSKMNAVIISPKTIAENTFLKQFYKRNSLKGLFIGLNDNETEGRFVWEDGTPLKQSEAVWCKGQPDNYMNNEDCVELLLVERDCINDILCEKTKTVTVICQVQATVIDPKEIVKCSSEQWEQHDGKCYWFDPTIKTSWDDGADLCSRMGAVMISPKTDTEKTFMKDFKRRKELSFLWVGVNDKETEGKFVWQDGTSLQQSEEGWNESAIESRYAAMICTDNPDNASPAEDCAESRSDGWNDLDCSLHRQIICEVKAIDGQGTDEPCTCTCSVEYKSRIDYSKTANKDLLKVLEPKLNELDKILRVNKSKLSKTRNKLTSKSDDRLSSKGMGLVAVTFLVLTCCSIVAVDLSNCCKQRRMNSKIANTP